MKAMTPALCVVFVVPFAGCSGGADLGAGGETGGKVGAVHSQVT